MRTAIEVASLPQVASSPIIVRLLDVRETADTTGEYAYPGVLGAVWELADRSLHEFLQNPDDDRRLVAGEVETNVGQALAVLHGLGWIHLDVAPNNVLRVDGVWKLAAIGDESKRSVVASVPRENVPTADFVAGFSRLGMARLGEG